MNMLERMTGTSNKRSQPSKGMNPMHAIDCQDVYQMGFGETFSPG